ncbi:MAG: hypothetical protein V1897_03585 [Pseudomonadota bacterium]
MSIIDEFQSTVEELSGDISDWALETLLNGMSLAFRISESGIGNMLGLDGYNRNIEQPFRAVYVFCDEDKAMEATARFLDGKMLVSKDGTEQWDLKVSFRDVKAFWRFMLSGGDDIVDSILANDVEVYGNVNHLHKFGFMAKDLIKRLGLS